MHSNIIHAETEITNWLIGEHSYQSDQNRVAHNAVPQLSIDYGITHELPRKWHHFQLFASVASEHEDDLMHMQANQRLLEACAVARDALFWSYVLEDKPVEIANAQTWEALAAHYERLRKDPSQYPKPTMAHVPLATLVHPAELLDGQDTAKITTIFEKIAGIALVHLASTSSFVLPTPSTRIRESVRAS